jgi:pSer/pThr/pTyr-binding forkhead associated (FHA) protein
MATDRITIGKEQEMPVQPVVSASLMVLTPASLAGQRLAVGHGEVRIGRDPDSWWVLDDPQVSRHHARLVGHSDRWFVEDLASSTGTYVNGAPIRGLTPLNPGDAIALGSIRVRFEGVPASPSAAPLIPATDYQIQDQAAHLINNVARDQHNSYQMSVLRQRDSFLREVAASKSRARILVWLGSLLLVLGSGTWGYVVLGFIDSVPSFGPDTDPFDVDLLGPEVLPGVPVGVLGIAGAFLGLVLIIAGIVLHVTSTARRRRVEQQYPIAMIPAAFPS